MHEPTSIYEDKHVLVVNKPSGLVMHSGVGSATEETLAGWVLEHHPTLALVGEHQELVRPGMVHRLDRETSGVVVLAKHQEAFVTLKRHFQKGSVQKEYHAFVHGAPKQSRGTITHPIGRSSRDFRKRAIRHARGAMKDAYTEYVVVSRCPQETSFMHFYPKTGRTHQIRVHAQALQVPIVGDTLYAPKRKPCLGFSRLALHARRLSLTTHLTNGETIDFVAPYPDDFQRARSMCS